MSDDEEACPKCQGDGGYETFGWDDRDREWVKCRECGGQGSVIKTPEVPC